MVLRRCPPGQADKPQQTFCPHGPRCSTYWIPQSCRRSFRSAALRSLSAAYVRIVSHCMVFPSYRTVFTIKMRPSTITIIVNSMLLAPKPIVGISDITISVITPAASITARVMNIALNANLLIPLRPYRQFGANRGHGSVNRYPSYFSSCVQAGPVGGCLATIGRQG